MGWVMGLEPTTPGTTIRCSNQLSYTHHVVYKIGTPGGTRTPGLLLRRQLLYPPELLAHSGEGLERAMGIEPTSPAWKAGALAVVLHPHTPVRFALPARPKYNSKLSKSCQCFFYLIHIFLFCFTSEPFFYFRKSVSSSPSRRILRICFSILLRGERIS